MVGLKYPKPSVSPSAEPAPTDKVNPNEAAPTDNAVKSDAAVQEALTSDTLASEEETSKHKHTADSCLPH